MQALAAYFVQPEPHTAGAAATGTPGASGAGGACPVATGPPTWPTLKRGDGVVYAQAVSVIDSGHQSAANSSLGTGNGNFASVNFGLLVPTRNMDSYTCVAGRLRQVADVPALLRATKETTQKPLGFTLVDGVPSPCLASTLVIAAHRVAL